jgi:hypothetical protein
MGSALPRMEEEEEEDEAEEHQTLAAQANAAVQQPQQAKPKPKVRDGVIGEGKGLGMKEKKKRKQMCVHDSGCASDMKEEMTGMSSVTDVTVRLRRSGYQPSCNIPPTRQILGLRFVSTLAIRSS